jgi:hypothetical protein
MGNCFSKGSGVEMRAIDAPFAAAPGPQPQLENVNDGYGGEDLPVVTSDAADAGKGA